MLGFLLSIFANRQKQLVDKDIKIYKRESIVEVDEMIIKRKNAWEDELLKLAAQYGTKSKMYYDEIANAAVSCANDIKEQEHKYHTEMAKREANLTILEAQIECLEAKHRYIQEIVDAEDKIKSSMLLLLEEKQKEINTLNNAVEKLMN